MSQENGTLSNINIDQQPPSADLLGDMLGPLAIEGPPTSNAQPQKSTSSELEGTAIGTTAIVPAGEQINSVQVV